MMDYLLKYPLAIVKGLYSCDFKKIATRRKKNGSINGDYNTGVLKQNVNSLSYMKGMLSNQTLMSVVVIHG
jgi:hypothetical protein